MAQTVEQYQAAQTKEWGTYVALVPIDVGTARAFNPGDPVPVSHVDAGLVPADSVAKVSTKAAQAVTPQES